MKDDGGPAFPDDGQANYTGGMTLLDWFAGTMPDPKLEFRSVAAAARFMGEPEPETDEEMVSFGIRLIAKTRYMAAEAMIAEKRRREGV